MVAVNISGGSPYYNPHICSGRRSFRPATAICRRKIRWSACARQIDAARQCKQAVPEMPMVGTGYSYLQDYLPHVAQAVVRARLDRRGRPGPHGAGVSRTAGRYVCATGRLARKHVCRTFSDCTTAPRKA